MSISRLNVALVCIALLVLAGCNGEPGPIEKVAISTGGSGKSADKLPPQEEPAIESESRAESLDGTKDTGSGSEVESEAQEESGGSQQLELPESRIRFEVPAGWKKVQPQNNIIEAEFELARVDGDEYDGRLTLMSSSGDPDVTIANRTAEFNLEPGEEPSRRTIEVAGVEATLVDLRGEWKGMSFRPIPPRGGYRMLLVIVPVPQRAPFYAKLTGPRATLAAHEDEFRAFLKSARVVQ